MIISTLDVAKGRMDNVQFFVSTVSKEVHDIIIKTLNIVHSVAKKMNVTNWSAMRVDIIRDPRDGVISRQRRPAIDAIL
ncbi:hypothetical protein [Roseovarius sp. THAF8]|uniref:hypothetical protein n=1 Tax=Roseovarius sp. THAF8 TaxID=2587846 RepID=UPI0015625BAB|nr:hypothetical protein [Roseovarius sp. THAF8]